MLVDQRLTNAQERFREAQDTVPTVLPGCVVHEREKRRYESAYVKQNDEDARRGSPLFARAPVYSAKSPKARER